MNFELLKNCAFQLVILTLNVSSFSLSVLAKFEVLTA